MLKCACGNEVHPLAKSCPNCGAPEWKIKKIAKEAFLASLTPAQLEKENLNERKTEKKEKISMIIFGSLVTVLAIMFVISKNNYHSKPIHKKATAMDLLADVTGWNETVREYRESDSRLVKCGSIKIQHKSLVQFSSGSTKDIKMWEKRWRKNKCQNDVDYPVF